MKEQLPYLIREGKTWVLSQQDRHRNAGSTLSRRELNALAPFFGVRMLDSIRVCWVDVIENPLFYEELLEMGKPIPIDFREMGGIAYVDTILLARARIGGSDYMSLLFHECVHVVQYQVLGVDAFVDQYVNGWAANGFAYEKVPLEQDACQLQALFEKTPTIPFRAEAEVRSMLQARGCLP
jgi:hypothetical protein